MNDDKEKEGVVIDVSPEPEESPEQNAEFTDEKSPVRRGGAFAKAPLIIAVLALILVVGALVAAYQYSRQAGVDLASINQRLSDSLQQQQQLQRQLDAANAAVAEQTQRLNAQQSQAAQQQQELAEARKRFDAQEKLLDSERTKMQEREVELRASVADVHKRVGASGTQWMVAEAEYLLRLANQRLDLARDVDTARSALTLADQRLADTDDPGWNAVRHQIAREIASLDATALPDVAGLSAKLNALAEQVPQLRLAHATLGGPPRLTHKPAERKDTAPKARTWDTLLDDLWAGFKDTVRIHRNNQPVQAMLAPDQQFFLYENLRLQLETARLGLARGDQQLYRDSLTTVANWLGSYFAPADPLTQSMRKRVNQLTSIDIRPPLPDISQSLRSLEARRKLNQDLGRSLPGAGGQTQ